LATLSATAIPPQGGGTADLAQRKNTGVTEAETWCLRKVHNLFAETSAANVKSAMFRDRVRLDRSHYYRTVSSADGCQDGVAFQAESPAAGASQSFVGGVFR
jgi:hypothetical protein